MLANKNFQNIIIFLIFLISLLWLKQTNFLFYNSAKSPDYSEYLVYFKHFANPDFVTGREHGLMYYYLHYFNSFYQYNSISYSEVFMHKSIQEVNFWIYIYGLLGYFCLLKLYKFENSTIFITFLFLNFFPISIVLRLVLKPEILAFSLLPWILFCIENYKLKKETLYLYLSIPLFVSCITLKGNILGIICIYLLITNLNIFSKIKKIHIFIIFLLTTTLFLAVSFENSSANEKNILDVQSGATKRDNYNYKAPYSIVYKVNIYNLVTSPIKHYHADSFIGITLLETSGDYFDLYWNSDSSNYSKGRKEIIRFETSNEIKKPKFDKVSNSLVVYTQKDTDLYLRRSVGLIISMIFYFLLFKTIFKNSEYRKYTAAFIIGGVLLVVHSITGFPVNNFDPNVGDTFKPHYYSFLFLLSTIFFVASNIKKNKKSIFYIIIYIFIMLFLLGFPKKGTEDLNLNISNFIEYSEFCNLENNIYKNKYDIENVDCLDTKVSRNMISTNKYFGDSFTVKLWNILLIFSSIASSIFITIHRRYLKQ